MRLDGIRGRGIGPFRELFEVNFDRLSGLLVAVTGENGAGKSTFLELLPGAMYRDTPSRGTLGELAKLTGIRDAFVEVRAVNASGVTIKQTVDGKNGKGDSILLDSAGVPMLPSAKRSAFDVWAATHLPDRDVYFSTLFAAQRVPGLDKVCQSFLSMTEGGRKSVLVRVLGVERVEQMIKGANAHGNRWRAQEETLSARLADERARSGDASVTRPALEQAEAGVTAAQETARAAAGAAAAARAGAEAARAAGRELATIRHRRAKLAEALASYRTQITGARSKIENNRKVLADADQIRKDVARAAELDLQIVEAKKTQQKHLHLAELADRDHDAAQAKHVRASQRAEAFRARAAAAAARLGQRPAIEQAEAAVPLRQADVEAADAKLANIDQRLAQLGTVRLDSAHDRIGLLRTGLEDIALGVDIPEQHASEVLEADNDTLRMAAESPKALEKYRSDRDAAVVARSRSLSAMQKTRDLAAARGALAAAEAEEATAQTDARAEDAVAQDASTAMATAGTLAAEHRAEAAPIAAKLAGLETEREELRASEARFPRLEQAQTRLEELVPHEAGLAAQEATASAELAGLAAPGADPPIPDVAGPEAAHAAAIAQVGEAGRAHAAAETRHAAATAAVDRIAELARQRLEAEHAVADWNHLAADLEAVKVLEIDAAGPELTEMSNDLLHACHGPRWSVSIETTRPDSKGKRQLEGCEVIVHDGEKGVSLPGERLSGGEGVIVGEAISLSFAMLGANRTGLRGVTLVRDETGAALSPKNAIAYVAMLRRAADLIGASKVLFVSHDPFVQTMADSKLVIANGRIEVA